ncbi:C factor, cell signaling protein [Marivivens niveibacter]|uniref:C factor, cell signaling protein n=1 Tax=Marivivens niveibacter TaxID=1930667 RepID=A0A251X216_9RHOB|nr:SDR family NAD(P)-dependent oxidoreductase [Marivivens niveibacter]OUD10213.1 C factor, cell signaling protein [Marivivens niveibacter]
MKRNLVIGASGGIGAAMVQAMDGDTIGLSRSVNGLDVCDDAGVARLIGDLDGPFDRIFVAVGILAPEGAAPEKSLAAIDPDVMARVFAVNTIGVATVLKHAARKLAANGRLGVLTARVGSIGDNNLGGWHSYRASKAAANQIIRGAALEMKRTHRDAVVLALHPGTVETSFTANYKAKKLQPTESAQMLLDVLDSATETGGFYDYAGKPIPW